jgi:alkyl hydroperoxide reductase subunit AhpF
LRKPVIVRSEPLAVAEHGNSRLLGGGRGGVGVERAGAGVAGVFLATGDVADRVVYRQAVTSAGTGAAAAR